MICPHPERRFPVPHRGIAAEAAPPLMAEHFVFFLEVFVSGCCESGRVIRNPTG